MSVLGKINPLRRRITRAITKNIGKSSQKNINVTDKIDVKRVLICRPNHRLGNLLLITPLIDDVVAVFPECEIDVLVKGGLAPILFENYHNIKRTIELPRKPFKNLIKYIRVFFSVKAKKYDLVINTVERSSSGKLLTSLANSKHKIFGELSEEVKQRYNDHVHMAKSSVYTFREYLKKSGHIIDAIEFPVLDLKLGTKELEKGKELLYELVNNNKKTISLFTNATGAKCYSELWWNEFYEELKETYPMYNIVEILPVENISKIGFKAPSYYSKELREIAAFAANTEVFIGADSGVMHLASAGLATTVGLFSVTDYRRYGPYGGDNRSIYTGDKSVNDCINIVTDVISKKEKVL